MYRRCRRAVRLMAAVDRGVWKVRQVDVDAFGIVTSVDDENGEL